MKNRKNYLSFSSRGLLTITCAALLFGGLGTEATAAGSNGGKICQGQACQAAADGLVGMDAARETALADAAVAASAVIYTKGELERDHGVLCYDIDFYTADKKYDYDIDASTGEIAARSVKVLNPAPQSSQAACLELDAAKSIALEHAGVSADDTVFTKARLEPDDGRMEYELKFRCGGVKYKYEIDAVSGSILEYEFDKKN